MRVGAAVLLLCGCGRIAFDPIDAVTDASSADVTPVSCQPVGPFKDPVRITELASDPDPDFAPSLSADALTIVWERGISGAADLYMADRPDRSSPFGAPIPLGVNTSEADANPSLSPDGLTVYFHRGASTGSILVATRPDRASNFTTAAPVLLAGDPDVFAPEVSDDGLEMIYSTDKSSPENGVMRIARRSSTTDAFVSVRDISELDEANTTESWPSLSADRLTLYYVRHPRNSTIDVYVATRPDVDSPFENPRVFDDVDAPDDTGDPEITSDGREFFVSTARGTPDYDLWRYTRDCH